MNSLATALSKTLRASSATRKLTPAFGNEGLALQGSSKLFYSTGSFDTDNENDNDNDVGEALNDNEFAAERPELVIQGVDPKKGWNYRGVYKAIISGKVGQAPIQKILRNGRTVTIFTVGTGGMFDQRLSNSKDLSRPVQWHRIAVHNEALGAYSVKQIVKNSIVYVEGDMETRVYNDSINGEIKSIPEICVRRDGRIRLLKSGERISSSAIEELKEGLLSVQDN